MSDGYEKVESFTLEAAADLRLKQWHVMRLAGEGLVNQASHAAAAAAVGAIGVLQDKPNTGQAGAVGYSGMSKVVVGASVTAGRLLTTNSSGRAVHAVSGDITFGRSVTGASNNGDVIRAMLFPAQRLSGTN